MIMGYYDNVKDNVRNKSRNGGSGSSENSSGSSGSSGSGNFETLKEAASEEDEEEQQGDDTPIEVLEEDGLRKETPSGSSDGTSESRSESTPNTDGNPLKKNQNKDQASGSSETSSTGDFSELERKLDKIIEQNDEMIRILRSFAE
jgi:hypothetical protein